MYIAIAGNIGSGKTTLTEMLTARYGAKAYFEEPNNPYLSDFYKDMSRWSFNLQLFFLMSHIEQTKDIVELSTKGDQYIIQDRTIYEDAHIFADNLHKIGMMSDRDFATYTKSFDLFSSFIPKPDLLIYLKSDVESLSRHIALRGRDYESDIDIEYLRCLNDKYENWIENIYDGELMVVDMTSIDYVSRVEDFESICKVIEEKRDKIRL